MADIVVGYDGSDCARAALDAAVEVARRFGDRVVVAYAAAPPDRLRGEEWKAHREALREIGEQVTSEGLLRATGAGVDAEAVLVPERPTQALLALAEERDARMIAVGTYGEAPIAGVLLGSVPYKLLHRSRIPVLVVPAQE